MWSCDRRFFLIAAVALAGCGFSPAYGPGGSGNALRNALTVTAPSSTYAFSLAQALETEFGPPLRPRYDLSFTVITNAERVAITQAQDTNRYTVIGSANFTLTEIATGAVLTTGIVDSFTSYSASGTLVATAAAQRDAYERLMVILGDKISGRLLTTPLGATP